MYGVSIRHMNRIAKKGKIECKLLLYQIQLNRSKYIRMRTKKFHSQKAEATKARIFNN